MTVDIGKVATFTPTSDSNTTEAGIVIGQPDTTHWVMAYDFALPNGGQIVHCKEYSTTAISVVSNEVD